MSCQLVIETNSPFYGGSVIKGHILCNFDETTTVRSIKVRATGDEHTEWSGTDSRYDPVTKKYETTTVPYTGDHNIFTREEILYGGSGENRISSGTYTYPFQITLPVNIPSSFEGIFGYIRYKMKAIVDRPMRFDYEDLKKIIIAPLIDLNKFPVEYQRRVPLSDEKTVCCLCCASGPVSLEIEIPKRTFVLGEMISIKAEVTNMSNVNVDDISATLKQEFHFRTNSPNSDNKYDKKELASYKTAGVGAHGENSYVLELKVPNNVIVPNLEQAVFIKSNYYIKVEAAISGLHADLKLESQVHLGHIPYGSSAYQQPSAGFVAPPVYQPNPALSSSGPYSGAHAPYSGSSAPPYPGGPALSPFPLPLSPSYNPSSSYPSNTPFSNLPGGDYLPPNGPPAYPPTAPDVIGPNPKTLEAAASSGPPSAPAMAPPSYDESQLFETK